MSLAAGFCGLGAMGLPIARNLLDAGYRLAVWNRTPGKAADLLARGAAEAPSPGAATAPDGIAVTMLADDRALAAVVEERGGLLERLGPGGVHLSMSTVSPALARRLAGAHAARGAAYVAAPVFGRPEAAAARRLWIAVSGPAAARERVRPILEALGQGVFEFGGDPGAAHVVKLAGNFMIASAVESLGEALVLAERNGVDPATFADMLGRTLFAAPIYQGYGKLLVERRFVPPGFRMPLGLKDLGLILDMARSSRVPVPLGDLVHRRLLTAMARGREDWDMAAFALGAREDAGLD